MRLIRLLKKDLAMEASIWVDRQLISIDQARAICRFYGVDYDDAIRNRSTAYRVLVVLGFLFIGLSLLLTAFLRYVDLIGSYLDSAILFMGLAVLLLDSARYWKVRQSGEGRR